MLEIATMASMPFDMSLIAQARPALMLGLRIAPQDAHLLLYKLLHTSPLVLQHPAQPVLEHTDQLLQRFVSHKAKKQLAPDELFAARVAALTVNTSDSSRKIRERDPLSTYISQFVEKLIAGGSFLAHADSKSLWCY